MIHHYQATPTINLVVVLIWVSFRELGEFVESWGFNEFREFEG